MEKKKKVAVFIPVYLLTLLSGYFFYQEATSEVYDWKFYGGLIGFLLISSIFIWVTVRLLKVKTS
jgi:hypothetical protein